MESMVNSGFFNIGTGNSVSINELAAIMIKISDHKEGISYLESVKGDVNESKANTDLTKAKFNWNYSINLEDGLKQLIKENY